MSKKVSLERDLEKKRRTKQGVLANSVPFSISPKVADLIAGATAGGVCATAFSPLDVTKLRMQAQGGLLRSRYEGGLVQSCRTILKEEGIRGWFRGYCMAILIAPVFWSCYFSCYSYWKERYRVLFGLKKGEHSCFVYAVSAASSGAFADIVTNPLWVVKTRLTTQFMYKAGLSGTQHYQPRDLYNGAFHCARMIYLKEGATAFFKGLSASLLGCSHVAVQFPVYEFLRAKLKKRRVSNGGSEELSTYDVLVASIMSKVVATTTTYPHEVLRTRLQDQQTHCVGVRGYTGLTDCVRTIFRVEGLSGFYRGLSVNIQRAAPACAITFVSFEHTRAWLVNWRGVS